MDFGVTLMTLRQALEVLERDGLITRRHGLGTFVASPSVDYDILHFRRLRRRPHGRRRERRHALPPHAGAPGPTGTRRASSGSRPAPASSCSSGLRLVDGHPTSFQVSHLPAALGEEVAKADLAVTPLRQVLAFKLGIEITGARETVSAETLPARAARELGCAPGVPCFRSDRVSTDAESRPIVYDRVFIPGDRFRITRQLHYDRSATA